MELVNSFCGRDFAPSYDDKRIKCYKARDSLHD